MGTRRCVPHTTHASRSRLCEASAKPLRGASAATLRRLYHRCPLPIVLARRLSLLGGAPDVWQVPATEGAEDDVYCAAPALPAGLAPSAANGTGGVPVAVSLNGQQFHPLAQAYARWAPPLADELATLPTSGPIGGGTVVEVTGPGLGGGDDYRCRFGPLPEGGNETRATVLADEVGGLIVRATYTGNDTLGTVACTSPPAGAGAGVVQLQVAPNAQHFTPVIAFTYYADVTLSGVSPASGPTGGGTALTVTGAGLGGGARPECWLGTGRVSATVNAEGTRLECEAPTGAGTGDTRLRIALNAQQASGGLDYAYYEHAALWALYPDNGDRGGGTTVVVNASAGFSFANGSDHRCRYAGAMLPETRATYDANAEALTCTSPAFPASLLASSPCAPSLPRRTTPMRTRPATTPRPLAPACIATPCGTRRSAAVAR